MTTQELAGRVAIVTGASSGIGRATAELLASKGALVTAFARSADRLRELAGEHVHTVAGDVADASAIERLFAETESRFGDCDILVNNAGMTAPNRIDNMTAEDWDRMFAVNVRGAFFTCKRAVPSMIAKRAGAIVNV